MNEPGIRCPPPIPGNSNAFPADVLNQPLPELRRCCATYRISFYWGEADDAPGGWVPVAWTEKLTPHLRAMRGSNAARPCCEALDGTVGTAVSCRIYEQRPSPCREFQACGDDGSPDPRCQAARVRHGLPPLPPSGP